MRLFTIGACVTFAILHGAIGIIEWPTSKDSAALHFGETIIFAMLLALYERDK